MSEAVTTEKYFNVSVPLARVPVSSLLVAQPVFIKAIQHTLYETK